MSYLQCFATKDSVVGVGHRLIDHQPDEFDLYLAGRQARGLRADEAVLIAVAKVRRDHVLT